MQYTTLPVIRTKKLTDNYTEIITKRKREIVYKPGDCLLIKKPASDDYRPYFLASGTQEAWLRIIVRCNTCEIISGNKIRTKHKPFNVFPSLVAVKKPVFICSGIGASPFLSYMSTFPSEEVQVYITPGTVNEEWLTKVKQAKIISSASELRNVLEVKQKPEYYICAESEQAQAFKQILLDSGIKEKKIQYMDFL